MNLSSLRSEDKEVADLLGNMQARTQSIRTLNRVEVLQEVKNQKLLGNHNTQNQQ